MIDVHTSLLKDFRPSTHEDYVPLILYKIQDSQFDSPHEDESSRCCSSDIFVPRTNYLILKYTIWTFLIFSKWLQLCCDYHDFVPWFTPFLNKLIYSISEQADSIILYAIFIFVEKLTLFFPILLWFPDGRFWIEKFVSHGPPRRLESD